MNLPEIGLIYNCVVARKGSNWRFSRDCVRCFEGRLTLKKDSSYGRNGFIWRCTCTKKECGYKVSVRAGTWFKNSHLRLKEINCEINLLLGA